MSDIIYIKSIICFVESEEELPQECTIIGQKKGEIPEKENTWKNYTPKNLKEKKHKKLSVYNKPAPNIHERNSLYELKQKYFQQKLQNLQNEDIRKQEKHNKEMELLQIQIEQQRNL